MTARERPWQEVSETKRLRDGYGYVADTQENREEWPELIGWAEDELPPGTPGYYQGGPELGYVRREVEVLCCGTWMSCHRFTNTCSGCGTDYGGSGDALAPRWQWGAETGESLQEILSIDGAAIDALLEGDEV